jgi:hypothetical protein
MGKGSAILGIIGILIGAGGLVFGFLAWDSVRKIQTNQKVNEVWYAENNGPFTVTPAFTVIELSFLNITFELDSESSVYFSFTCWAEITPDVSYSSIFFFFRMDGANIVNPFTRVGNNQGGSSNDYFSVSLQHFIENLVAGSHNITLGVSTESAGGILTDMTLFVQSYS